MFFYLTTLSLQRFINENVPVILEDTPPEVVFGKRSMDTLSFLCKNYILSDLQDDLYNVYSNVKISKAL